VPSDRHILHCDCNSFYASVEETFCPKLKQVAALSRYTGLLLIKDL